MIGVRIREFQGYQYKDPRAWLRELREIELLINDSQLGYRARSLRTHKLREWHESRIAALFAFGISQRMPGFNFDFAKVDRSDLDYDTVIRWHNYKTCCYTPVQLKEFVPEELNENASVEKILDGLAKYGDSSDLVVVVFLNRRMRIRLHPISSSKVKLGGLYFMGAASPDRSQWMLMGDLLRSTEASKFKYPRTFREEFTDLTFPSSRAL